MTNSTSTILIFWILSLCASDTDCQFQKRQALKSLEEFVFGSINKTIPPLHDDETGINVTLAYLPFAVLDLDAAREVLSTSSYLQLNWRDKAISWNPDDYHGHHMIEINHEDIWTPKIALIDNIVHVNPLVAGTPITVTFEGTLTWQLTDVFHTRCKIDVKDYPFDYQTCHVTFLPSYGYPVNLRGEELPVGKVRFVQQNGEWTLVKTNFRLQKVSDKLEIIACQFTFTLRRQPTYFIINIIFPMALLSLLNPCVFLVPARSGEKLSFLMAIFVSHAMFLNLIHQSMPPTSDAVSTLAMFLAFIEAQGFLTILATIVVLCVHHRKEKEKERLKELSKEHFSKEYKGNSDQLVEVKRGGRLRICCKDFSLERFLDAMFFIFSIGGSLVACGVLWHESYKEGPENV